LSLFFSHLPPALLHLAPRTFVILHGYLALAMKFSITSLLSATLFVAGISADLTITTPLLVVECQSVTITWSTGTGPYFLSVHSGGDPNGPSLVTFPGVNTTSLIWSAVNFSSGTDLEFTLRDSAGSSAQSSTFTVKWGGDESCLSGTTTITTHSSSATPVASSATTPAGSVATLPVTKLAPTASGSSASSYVHCDYEIQYAVAGLLGAAIAAAFV